MSKGHYYLFDANYTIVKSTDDGMRWYKRDRIKHTWIEEYAWEFFLDDLDFDVIEIDYDEEHERILNRRRIKGRWSATDGHLFDYENHEKEVKLIWKCTKH